MPHSHRAGEGGLGAIGIGGHRQFGQVEMRRLYDDIALPEAARFADHRPVEIESQAGFAGEAGIERQVIASDAQAFGLHLAGLETIRAGGELRLTGIGHALVIGLERAIEA